MVYRFYNEDCVAGAKKHIKDDSVDLIITDPPYGIGGDTLDKHYNRNESTVIDGYVDIPQAEYAAFSQNWIAQAERILKPGGSLYIVSGYTNLIHILNALHATRLKEINHIIWRYNFGVYTKRKYISAHYHILYYVKDGGGGGAKPCFNTFCRYAEHEKNEQGGAMNYRDREDVWCINKDYKPGQVKNKNELPTELLVKMMQYSSNEGDLVCDLFLGSFSTAKVAKGLNRQAVGFEVNKNAFDHQLREINALEGGFLLQDLRQPPENIYSKQGQPITDAERDAIRTDYQKMRDEGLSKKQAIEALSLKYARGPWSLAKMVAPENTSPESPSHDSEGDSSQLGLL